MWPLALPNQVGLTSQNREILMKTIVYITVRYGKKSLEDRYE